MTEEQWRTAWILCEIAGDLDVDAQREYVHGVTVDAEVERHVLAVFEELEAGPSYPAPPDRRAGDTVGRYHLLERIGQGGMGEVYAAEDTELRRTAALKFLPVSVTADQIAASQVISEARLACRLNHPNIVTVHELIQTPWGLAIAMELVEGQSLRKLLRSGKLSAPRLIHIARQLASALAAAHEKGIVHRDIKPENIMVRTEDDFVKILDFSLAQNLRDRAAAQRNVDLPVGTLRYMSPEQKAGWPATAAGDVYSLALVLEEAGDWKHSILTRMRATDPLRRTPAREVEQRLAKLEAPSRYGLVFALVFSLLLVPAVALYWLRTGKEHAFPRFEQITHYSSGHDVMAAALSRSGDQLAFATIDGGFFVRDNRTRQVREITGPENLICYQLLFTSDRHLLAIGSAGGKFVGWQIALNSESPRKLSDDVQLAVLSHDGKKIAWLNGIHQVWAGANTLINSGLIPGPESTPPARLLMEVPRGTHVAALFWSGDDRQLWFHRLSGCRDAPDHPDPTINPDLCQSSDLATVGPGVVRSSGSIAQLRFSSGFFTGSGEFIFLRQDFAGRAEGFNLWSARVDAASGRIISPPAQISHFSNAAFSHVMGKADGQTFFMIRTDSSARIYTADWQPKPAYSLRLPLRLTFEQSYNYPHSWTAGSQAVLFESGRNGHFEILRQNRNQHEPQLLVSSARENFYPQLSSDGKWILFMSARRTQDAGFADLRLMRAPAQGGPLAEVPIGEPLDEFRCSAPGVGNICVLRTSHDGRQAYYELDPVKGKGRELGRTDFAIAGLGRWALSADGRYVAIPDTSGPGRFIEMRLDVDPSKRRQLRRRVSGIYLMISGMNPGPSSGEWLAWTDPETRAVHQLNFPPFSLVPSQFSALYFVDAHSRAHLLENDSVHAFGLFSPDGKHVAAIRDELTSNIWSFAR